MTTWESRMAAKAKSRAVPEPEPESPNDIDKDLIRQAVAEIMSEGTSESPIPRTSWACACVGPIPKQATLCPCHVRVEAECRLLGRACTWRGCKPT